MNPGLLPPPRLPVLGWQSMVMRSRPPAIPAVTQEREAVFVSAGRAAIFLALELLGVQRGDRVLVPTYHCPTMVAPVTELGAVPQFYPITRSASPDLDWLSAADLSCVRAMVAVHFFGVPQPMGALKRFCSERGIALIEDCAHAFFGRSGQIPLGATGDLAIASLPKFFPVLEGGCLIGPRALLARTHVSGRSMVEELRAAIDVIETGAQHGRFGSVGSVLNWLVSLKRRVRSARIEDSIEDAIDTPADRRAWLDENVLRRSATAITRWVTRHSEMQHLIERRRANYALWSRLTKDSAQVEPLFPDLSDDTVPYVFPLKVRDAERKYQALRATGVPVFRWDIAWPGVPDIPGDVGKGWLSEIFQLGCHQDLDTDDIMRLAPTVRAILEG